MVSIRNFGGNQILSPKTVLEPGSEQELLEMMRQVRGRKLRAVGSLHSWSDVVSCDDVLISVKRFNTVQVEDYQGKQTAVIGSGVQIKTIIDRLREKGLALPSLGLISEQTIAGATATGTHGSGRASLSTYIEAVRVARYDEGGTPVIEDITGGPELLAARCSLGCLGIIVSIRMQCRPMYHVEEHWRGYSTVEEVLKAEQEFPLQQFFLIPWRWNFLAQHRREVQSRRSGLAGLYRIYWYLLIDVGMHLLLLFASQLLKSAALVRLLFRHIIPPFVVRGWRVVDDSADMLIMEHELFRHIEMELFVPRAVLPQALSYFGEVLAVAGGTRDKLSDTVLQDLRSRIPDANTWIDQLPKLGGTYTHHYPICVRRVTRDATLISMASPGRAEISDERDADWYAISFVSYDRVNGRQAFFDLARLLHDSMIAAFGARPHWGKFHFLSESQIREIYPGATEFMKIAARHDSSGAFIYSRLKGL